MVRVVFAIWFLLLFHRLFFFNTGSGNVGFGLPISVGRRGGSETVVVVAPLAAVNFLGVISPGVEVIVVGSHSFGVVVGRRTVLLVLASFAFEELRVGRRGRVEILPVPDRGSLRRRARVGRVLVSSGIERGGRRGRRRGVGENVGKPPRLRLAADGRRGLCGMGRRDTWRGLAGGRAEKNSGSVLGDGEGLAGGEGGEGRAGETKGAAVVRVSGGEMVTSVDGVLHKTAPLLAATDSILTVELGGRASHGQQQHTLSLSLSLSF